MVAVSRYLPGETIPVVTGDANLYNGMLCKFSGSVDSGTGYPIVVIDTAASTDTAGVVDCGRVEGQAGTATSKYASGVVINIRRSGVVVLTDSGSGVTVGQYAVADAGTVSGTGTFNAETVIGRILNTAAADGNVYVDLKLS